MEDAWVYAAQLLATGALLPMGVWGLLAELGAGGLVPDAGAPRERVCAWLWSMIVAAVIAFLAPLAVLGDAILADPRLAIMWLAYAIIWPVMILGATRYARLMERLKVVEAEARAAGTAGS